MRYSIPDLQSRSHFQCEALNLTNAINAINAMNAINVIDAISMAITQFLKQNKLPFIQIYSL